MMEGPHWTDRLTLPLLLLLVCLQLTWNNNCLCSAEQLTSVQSKLDNLIYLYPNQYKKESELPECGGFEVCSTEHRRYWLPSWVHRHCRCQGSDCSEIVSSLDNRSLIKVCKSEKDKVEQCEERERGLEVSRLEGERRVVKITCGCHYPNYWALAVHVENSTLSHDRYACQPVKRCESGQFCGHIRTDTYSMYVQCACPGGHICLNRDRQERNVTEALYQGPAFRAYCTQINEAN